VIFYGIYKLQPTHVLFKKPISKKSLKVLDSLRVGPCFALKTLERMEKTQLGPWGSWPVRLAGIGWLRRRPWLGKVGRKTRDSLATGLCAWLGWRGAGEGGSAATAGASRGGLLYGEGRARPGRHVAVRAWVGTREATGGTDWRGELAEGWTHRRGPVVARGGSAHARTLWPLYRRRLPRLQARGNRGEG
jgi:hypothetical protein